ncbi:glycosyl hydrolases family 31-domain-containing protein [Cyathus striatus]|nr:glycosyl hydrolases family 31-domain-containing protein [Cyathus striatus]
MWWMGDGVLVDWATDIVKSEAKEDGIRFIASSKRVNHRGDTLNAPTLTFECSSPAEEILLLNCYHWKGQKTSLQGPEYELFPGVDYKQLISGRQDSTTSLKTDKILKFSTSSLSATVDTTPGSTFNVDFNSHGTKPPTSISLASDHLLTKLGWRSVGYIKRDGSSTAPKASLANPDKGERWTTIQFQLSVGEKIYGLGERFGPFVKNGQTVEMWNEDGGTSSELTYKNVPFYISSRGYGIFIPCSGFVSFEVQSERTTRVNIAVPYENVSAYIIHGPTPAAILERYTFLTGRPALPPPWTFGLWLTTSFTTSYDEKTVNQFLEGMEKRDIPVQIFHFDCFWMKGFHWCDFEFDEEYFPDAKGQLKRLKEKGYKICVWINPYIAQESKIFDEGLDNGYFIKKKDGSVWQTDFWQAGMGYVDFTNPGACKWYQSKLKNLLDMGVDCFKTDFGERIPTGNAFYHDGSNVDKMHNYYAFLFNKVVFEVTEHHKGKNEAIVFARSATAGGQRFPVHWGGDPMSTFEAMAETLRGGLSLGLCGFGYWAHDIGGFEGKPDPALYKRWFAFGALSSHSRLHGSGSYRVPWLIDPSGEADLVLKKFIALKHSLTPYLYATAIRTHLTGVPMMRPLFVEFPDDPTIWNIDTQYMLGSNILVAPVFNEEGDVQFYLPSSGWYSILDGKLRDAGWTTENHDFMSLPLLLRPGSAIVIGKSGAMGVGGREGPVYDWADSGTILVNTGKSGLDLKVEVPDWQKPGEIMAVIQIKRADAKGKLDVRLISGKVTGSWKLKTVVSEGDIEETDWEY